MDFSHLKPTEHHRVIDLLREAGLDVSDWANFAGGEEKAASNPKYCYDWSFREDSSELIVLNLWYSNIEIIEEQICQVLNLQEEANGSSDGARSRRAINMDSAINWAYRKKWPVRVIICDEEPNNKTQRANKRLLDPTPWGVAERQSDGTITLIRDYKYPKFVDQFSVHESPTREVKSKNTQTTVYERCKKVREEVLLRASGVCEYCGEQGFGMANGNIYLESHHIVPLSEGGPDTIQNVAALCPNHHREAHFGLDSERIKTTLLSKFRNWVRLA